ncbi:MAG TPA: type I polyketide synthase, partial [Baekduia sp.]|nr:type I polyketide synthase [Baekduia sp.]
MTAPADTAVAIVGVSAILPDAPDAAAFWRNVLAGRSSITDVDPQRWDPALYYDPDPHAPERTYSKIGGWVGEFEWNPLGWKLPIPPKVSDAMDVAQRWAVACTRMALQDAGWPERELDRERTAVILGNALSGEKHYATALRVTFPELARELEKAPSFAALPADARAAVEAELKANLDAWLPPITEDTMPGELGNCMAGRVANLFDLHGPNYVVDAACASAMAAMDAAIEGLIDRQFDVAITGGIDRNMGASTFIKFCAIGALSATGTRPYADGADGFVMGEGAAMFVLKRLADAERDGDRIYAVVRGIAGASDGRGKGITAPNPVGQRLAIQRAWRKAGLSPAACSLVEGHGTSTRVGDVVELESLAAAFDGAGLAPGSVALGSVKSNIGHLKGAAGAAGLLKTALALHEKVLPPSLHWDRPNPNVDWTASPFKVNTEARAWALRNGDPRTAGVSAFGFGGTNFHAVLEEHMPGRLAGGNGHAQVSVPADVPATGAASAVAAAPASAAAAGRAPAAKAPLRGALVLGAADEAGLLARLRSALDDAQAGRAPAPQRPSDDVLRSPERLAIDFADAADLAGKAQGALKALEGGGDMAWRALRNRGVFRGSGAPGKVAFLYTGQGSQYPNMLAGLRRSEPVVAEVFDEADRIMRPLLDGRALSDIIFVDPADERAVADAAAQLMRTEITQPAVLTVDAALTRLLEAYGFAPDMVMGHSLGEYGALVAAGVLSFADALEAVSARGSEMAHLSVEDNGAMAAVMAPAAEVERVVAEEDGYVVLANVNSSKQVVLGGATEAVGRVVARLQELGHTALALPVSHAFHTSIVAPAGEPLRAMLRRLRLHAPRVPVVANVDGRFYPPFDEDAYIDILGRQVASPVQFVHGLDTLYEAGARVFVEVGPKKALHGFAADVIGDDRALNLFTNHPKTGDAPSFNQALCGLWAAGLGVTTTQEEPAVAPHPTSQDQTYLALGRTVAAALEGSGLLARDDAPGSDEPVVVTGAALGLPGSDRLFDEANVGRLLRGQQCIDVIPQAIRHEIVDRHITRLVKGEDGSGHFEEIDAV